MLDLMRRKKRLKAVLWVVIVGLAMGMLLFFVPGQNIGGGGLPEAVATVNGEAISVKEFSETYRRFLNNLSRGSNTPLDPELLKRLGIERQAINALINTRVIRYAARRIGLEVSPQELRRTLESNPNFQNRGVFIGVEQYRALLAANQLDVGEFEEGLRFALLSQKVQNVIGDSIVVAEEDIRNEFIRSAQEAQVRFAVLKKEDYKKKVSPTEAELKAYFDANKQNYAIKEERRARYLLLSISQLAGTIKVTDQEVEAQWAKEARQENVEVSHILFKVEEPAKDAEVKAKAAEILKRAQAGEDFAKLAQTFSQDEASAQQGGNLGSFARGRMVKEFENAAFSMQVGQISDLVRSQFGYHIIKVLRHEIPDLKSEWKSVERSLQIDKASELAKQKSVQALQLVEKEKDLAAIAQSLGVLPDIQETGFFSREADTAAAGISASMVSEVFGLKEVNAVGKPVDMPAGYAIPQLLETRLPQPPDFNISRAAVTRDFTETKALEIMTADARRLSEEAKRIGDLEKAGKAAKMTVLSSKAFKRDAQPAPEIVTYTDFNTAAFELPAGSVSDPINVQAQDQVAVLQVLSQTPFDEAEYRKQKSETRRRLIGKWRDAYFQAYIQRVTEDLEKSGKIRINNEVLSQLTGP